MSDLHVSTAEIIAAVKETKKQRQDDYSDSIPIEQNPESLPYIDLSTVPLTEMSYLVEDFLPSGCISMIYGDGGQGKSYLALYLAALIATGKPFLNKAVNQGRVLYLDFELSTEMQRRRLERICRGLGVSTSSLSGKLYYLAPGIQDNISTSLNELIPAIKKEGFALTVIDSIGAALTGDPKAADDICRLFQQIRELGTVLLLDHEAKSQKGDKPVDKTPFGSVYKINLSRNVWHLNSKEGANNTLNCLLKHTKCNFTALKANIGLSYCFKDASFSVKKFEPGTEFSDCLSEKEQVLAAVNHLKNVISTEVAKETGISDKNVKARLSELSKAGKIKKTSEKREGLTIYKSIILNSIPIEQNQNNCYETSLKLLETADNPKLSPEEFKQQIKESFNAEIIPEGAPF